MAEGLAQTNSQELVRPGPLGRVIRACLGLATLTWLVGLLTIWREALWGGEIPLFGVGFLALVGGRVPVAIPDNRSPPRAWPLGALPALPVNYLGQRAPGRFFELALRHVARRPRPGGHPRRRLPPA